MLQMWLSTVVFYSVSVLCLLCGFLQGFKYAFLLSCFIGVFWSAHFVSCFEVQICLSTVGFYSIFVVCSFCSVLQLFYSSLACRFKYAFLLSGFIAFSWSAHCVVFCRGSNMPFYCRVL